MIKNLYFASNDIRNSRTYQSFYLYEKPSVKKYDTISRNYMTEDFIKGATAGTIIGVLSSFLVDWTEMPIRKLGKGFLAGAVFGGIAGLAAGIIDTNKHKIGVDKKHHEKIGKAAAYLDYGATIGATAAYFMAHAYYSGDKFQEGKIFLKGGIGGAIIGALLACSLMTKKHNDPASDTSKDNKLNEKNNNLSRKFKSYICFDAALGAFIGFVSDYMIDPVKTNIRLISKTILTSSGLAAAFGTMAVAVKVLAESKKDNKKQKFYENISSNIVIFGVGATTGNSLAMYTIGKVRTADKDKALKLQLKCGLVGGILTLLLAEYIKYKASRHDKYLNNHSARHYDHKYT